MEKYLEMMFKACCEQYFIEQFQQNRFLYFDVLPHKYFGTDYKIEITHKKFEWLKSSALDYDTCLEQNHNHGKRRCIFQQECKVDYVVRLNSLIELNKQSRLIKFYAQSFEPFELTIYPNLIADDFEHLNNFRELKLTIKENFKIKNIDEESYENHSIGFAFFTSILRNQRAAKSKDKDISHGYFYWEIANCHKEIETCLLTALLYQKYSSDFLNDKQTYNGKDFYIPTFSYNDYQYVVMIGFGFDRLYSFWDRITYLLANYENLNLDFKSLSFHKYCKEIDSSLNSKSSLLFDKNSKHLKWLMDFRKNEFTKVEKYRHRIVHYQMTQRWEGTLTSIFTNNAREHMSNFSELKKLKLEFEGLGNLLLQQFNFCKQGFIEALHLIDELK